MGEMAPIAVLHVDDDPDVLDLAATSLEGKSNQLRLRTASSGDDALSILREGRIDCVVSEYEMSDTTGLSLLESVREEFPDLPFILFTDTGSETIVSRAISAGVTDYLRKDISTEGYAILANRIESVVNSARTERALQESEERYRTVVEGSHDAVYIYQDDRFAFVNERACEITGYTVDELRGMDVWSLLHPDDHDRVRTIAENRMNGTHEVSTYDARFRTKDGEIRYGNFSVRATTYRGTTATIGSVRDVTEQVRIKEERDEILSRMTDAFLSFDEEWRFTYVNEQAEEVLNRTAPEIIGEVVWDVFPEAVETRFYDDNHEAMRVQEPMTFEEHFEPFDSWFEVNVYPSSNGVSVYLRDVTERKNREATLEALHNATRTLMQAETSAAVSEIAVRVARDVLDLPVTAIWDCEDSTVRLVARTEQHRVAYGESVPEADREAIADAFEANGTVVRKLNHGDVESEALVPLGARGVMSFAAERLDDFDVYYAQLLAANTAAALDRAEREDERTAHQRELARQNERLEEFASVVSHDLRNPLNVAQGYLDMYRSTGKREHLTRVERAHERMANIVKDVLTLTRQGRTVNETRPISGETVATNAWASVETGPATLDSSWNSIIDADASRLQQLLENLFRNALDHGRPDVTIRVGELTGVVEDGGLRQKTATGDAAAGFFVEDDGPGIPEAARKTVFESGYSTAESGTGLGLTIVRQIAEAHGWEVSLVAADDGGARFEFAGVEPVNE